MITKVLNLLVIRGHTRIGPVHQIRVICCLGQYGIEIQVPSASRDGSCSWTVISRSPNRYIDESRHDQDDPHRNVEMVRMSYLSKEFIQIDKRKWNDIPACFYVDKYSLDWKISKRLTALVRLREIDNREIATKCSASFRGDKILYQRIPTLRPAPKIVLEKAW